MTFMYSLIRPQGLEKNSKIINVGPTSIPEARVGDTVDQTKPNDIVKSFAI